MSMMGGGSIPGPGYSKEAGTNIPVARGSSDEENGSGETLSENEDGIEMSVLEFDISPSSPSVCPVLFDDAGKLFASFVRIG